MIRTTRGPGAFFADVGRAIVLGLTGSDWFEALRSSQPARPKEGPPGPFGDFGLLACLALCKGVSSLPQKIPPIFA